jgi:hypothetical protein
MYRRQKAEKFISAFCAGLDDPIMEAVLRVTHLGEPEEKLDEVIAQERAKMEEMLHHFELTDATQNTLTEEERQSIISKKNIENGDNNTNTDESSDKGHNHISLEYSTDNGFSAER